MIEHIDGQLEIDTDRGEVCFYALRTGRTVLRLCRVPYLHDFDPAIDRLDIDMMQGDTSVN